MRVVASPCTLRRRASRCHASHCNAVAWSHGRCLISTIAGSASAASCAAGRNAPADPRCSQRRHRAAHRRAAGLVAAAAAAAAAAFVHWSLIGARAVRSLAEPTARERSSRAIRQRRAQGAPRLGRPAACDEAGANHRPRARAREGRVGVAEWLHAQLAVPLAYAQLAVPRACEQRRSGVHARPPVRHCGKRDLGL